MSTYRNIIFDVGSVLVNWMRINLYTALLHGDRAPYIVSYWYCYKDMDGANQVGIQGILFTGSNNLKEQLVQLSIL